jgi:hypothetical protein
MEFAMVRDMATSRTISRLPAINWLLIAAGVFLLLDILFGYVLKPAAPWFAFLADAVLAIAFLFLFLRGGRDLVLRLAYVVAAVGFAILAIGDFADLGSFVGRLGWILAGVGFLVAGILGFVRHVFSRNGDITFLIAAILFAIQALTVVTTVVSGTVGVIGTIVFALLLIATGALRQGRR